MQRGLFYTTMVNHRPIYTMGVADITRNERINDEKSFHLTSPRDSSDLTPNPNNRPTPVLREILARSTQPSFSVSAMFRVRSGGGCGACGH
jgi:hypothetical protein